VPAIDPKIEEDFKLIILVRIEAAIVEINSYQAERVWARWERDPFGASLIFDAECGQHFEKSGIRLTAVVPFIATVSGEGLAHRQGSAKP